MLVAIKTRLLALKEKLRARLVADAHEWARWWSMRWILIAAGLDSLKMGWGVMPGDWIAALPHWIPEHLGFATLISTVMAAVSRVYKQKVPADVVEQRASNIEVHIEPGHSE